MYQVGDQTRLSSLCDSPRLAYRIARDVLPGLTKLRPLGLLFLLVSCASFGCSSRKTGHAESPPSLLTVSGLQPIADAAPARAIEFPRFSSSPSDAEITGVSLFEEPLVPIGDKSPSHVEETRVLAQAIEAYIATGNAEDIEPFTQFLGRYPTSAWRPSTLLNLGLMYRRGGYFLKALQAFEEAWRLIDHERESKGRALADLAAGQLVELTARLGQHSKLEALLGELKGRTLSGPATEKLASAREALWLMRNKPEEAFRCGPIAVGRLAASLTPHLTIDPSALFRLAASRRGSSLVQLANLAKRLGIRLHAIKRSLGAEVPVPSIVHWKAGHFAALVQSLDDERGQTRYLLQDPSFGGELWVSQRSLNDESSGFFLTPATALKPGWRIASASEARNVRGTGFTQFQDPEPPGPKLPPPGCPSGGPPAEPGADHGMPHYAFHALLVGLNIVDTPVGYVPPRGPPVRFTVTYNQKESFQPGIFMYSNLGSKWTFDWLSYVTDDPSNPRQSPTVYLRGGGRETILGSTYNPDTGEYAPHFQSHAVLVRTSPNTYDRRLPDGSKEVFRHVVGTIAPRKLFLTEIVDSAGNQLVLNYDDQHRLLAIVDAIGQSTAISYESSDPLKITKITDPFGRMASFEYNASNQLTRITDVINQTSTFAYGPGDFINTMSTPYGDTTFAFFQDDRTNRHWIEATDPNGDTEHVEFRHLAPGIPDADPPSTVPAGFSNNRYLSSRNTFFWDKRSWREHRTDYTKAYRMHWLHRDSIEYYTAGIMESEKQPLENRVWYSYPGQSNPYLIGNTAKPSRVARRLDDGTTQLFQYEYNDLGNVTKSIDPMGRTTRYFYAPNQIDLLEVHQVNGAVEDVIASFTYNEQHRPLAYTDAAGQTTIYSYNQYGQLLTVTNVLGQTTTLTYDANGFLTRIAGPIPAAVVDYTYDGVGRVRSATDSLQYAVLADYDALDRLTQLTYPDGTTQQIVYDRMDVGTTIDRLGRATQRTYDALRRLTSITDPLERTTSLTYCPCGALTQVIDPLGQTTTWNRDLQERVTTKVLDDGRTYRYFYEVSTSRLRRQVDPSGQATNFQYYIDNNVRNIGYGQAPPVIFSYGSSYNRLSTMVDVNGVTYYSYYPVAALGALRLASEESDLATMRYTYDELGRRLSRDIDGVASTKQYDALSRIAGEVNSLGAFSFDYLGATPKITSAVYPNGDTITFEYYPNEGDQRLRQIAANLATFRYGYDSNGNITNWTQDPGPGSATYRYDNADQLIGVDPKGSGFSYSYDAAGNRLTEQTPGAVLRQFTYNSTNELISVDGTPVSYDLSGNLLSDGVRTFEWDSANRLSSVSVGSHRTDFTYDGLGRRVRITERDGASITSDVRLLWCGSEICEERDASTLTVPKRFFDQGLQQGGQAYFYVKDHLGSIRVLSDNEGTLAARYEYDPYGRSTRIEGATDATFGYAGYYFHASSGLNLTLYRAYDSTLARWLSDDPIGFDGGSLNLYTYVNANPLQYTDPLGLYTELCSRPFYPIPVPYSLAMHCFIRFNGNNKDTSSFDPAGVHEDSAPGWWPKACVAVKGGQDNGSTADSQGDSCVRRAMRKCQPNEYEFLGFNCCNCAQQALENCGIHVPPNAWPNWPVNPAPLPVAPGRRR